MNTKKMKQAKCIINKYKDLRLKLLKKIFFTNNNTNNSKDKVYKNCIKAVGELSILYRDNMTTLNIMHIEQDLLTIKQESIIEFYGILELLKHDVLTIKLLLDEDNEPGVIYNSFMINNQNENINVINK